MTALDTLISSQPSLAKSKEALTRAAQSAAPILIQGEAGTGRSTLARALHDVSDRAGLVEADVGLIPATLFEGELFGYKRGAFTGAEESRSGLVARAEGGTLLLDHLEELPILQQPKLLRLLSENRYSPLGGRERSADVRFISIASAELQDRVRSGSFRQDLFYRLEVLLFAIPPLRERLQDLDALIEALLSDLSLRFARPAIELAPTSRAWMQTHDWPGNVRELRNVLERAVVLHEDGVLVVPEPTQLRKQKPRSLEELEVTAIRDALRFTKGHQGEAAELLGISRKTLWEKRRRHGIP